MRRSVFAALTIAGALVLGPAAAQAAPVVPFHAGHDHDDHGPKPEKPKDHHKDKHEHEGKKHHHEDDDGAHASGGYDDHRSHDAP